MAIPLKRELAISTLTTGFAAIISQVFSQISWPFILCFFIIVFLFARISPYFWRSYKLLKQNQRAGVRYVIFGSLALALIASWYHFVGPRVSNWFVSERETNALVRQNIWVTYDPIEFDPSTGNIPTLSSMKADLLQIKKAGFTGVITFSSAPPLDMIPRCAKEIGLAVIMGLWNPNDRREAVLAASAKEYVDGYSVGHNRLGPDYALCELVKRIRWLRLRTKRPVTTTERMDKYLHNTTLLTVGDWVFPDVHLSLRENNQKLLISSFNANVKRDIEETFRYASQIVTMARKHHKPVLLKMVTYPMAGINDASLMGQSTYFSQLLDSRRDTTSNLPLDIAISVHSAFDSEWKTSWPFYPWDRYTGLLDHNGNVRPAAKVVIERLP
jgi:exo-beta-1,3-glucanase (GH17 family)